MAKGRFWFGAIGIAVLATAYLAYPYYTLHRLGVALEAGDRPALEQLIDWPPLREGIKTDLNTLATRALAHHAGPDGNAEAALEAGLAAILMPLLVQRAVDAYVTPAGIAELMRRDGRIGDSDQHPTASERDWRFTVHRAGFTGPGTFQFQFSNPDDLEPGRAVGIMELQGLKWRLTRLILPIERLTLPRR